MKKVLLSICTILLLLTACSLTFKDEEEIPKQENPIEPDTSQEEVNPKEEWIEDTLDNLSLEEKIGQMLIVSDYSTSMTDELLANFNEVKPGGFILFGENIKSYEQTTNLIKDIKNTSNIPLFISIDQEGGRVQRIKKLPDATVSIIPPMYNLGLTNDINLAYEVGKVIGEELRVFDINMDFAPVLDIYSNPKNTVIGNRSFGTTAEIVSNMGISLAKGLENTGIIPVYKHFPGHGDTLEDSHTTLPIINKTKEELMDMELKPFIEAIENDAEIIMVSHLAVPKITGNNTPATLSKEIITDLLKEELGFDGIVITDALNMKALTNEYTEEEIYIKAINAGVDILLMPDFDIETINIIKQAITSAEISEEQIDKSVSKILDLKYDLLEQENIYTKEYLGSISHQEIISKITS